MADFGPSLGDRLSTLSFVISGLSLVSALISFAVSKLSKEEATQASSMKAVYILSGIAAATAIIPAIPMLMQGA